MHLAQIVNKELVLEPSDETQIREKNKQEETRDRRAPIIRSQSYIYEGSNSGKYNAGRHSVSSLFCSQLIQYNGRQKVLRYCRQTTIQPFEEVYAPNELRNCRKIGEGLFSEVFMYKHEQTRRPIVLKIIPIEGRQCVNGERQKKFDEILSELAINTSLGSLRYDPRYRTTNFVELLRIHCVQGKYPEHFVDLWELYRDNYDTLNSHPEIFDDQQLFVILELGNGGEALADFRFHNALQTYSAFLQVAISFAIAEKAFEFEHRDLHWGNILLLRTEETTITYVIGSKKITIPTYGVRATIIDFTLSRIQTNSGRCYFNDLSNQNDFFNASGDYQFDIYRLMRERVKNSWKTHDPHTNLLWLHYVTDKMISGVHYTYTKTKEHRTAIDRLMQIRDDLLDYKSAADFVQTYCDSYCAVENV